MAKGFRELEVWKKSHELVLNIHVITGSFPANEKYRLTDQLVRACMSIAMNIAEGSGRRTRKDFIHFLVMSRGSVEECKYLVILSKDLHLINQETFNHLTNELESISRMLNALIKSLDQHP